MKTEHHLKVTIIGSGFAGLSAACYLAKEGAEVTVIEKNQSAGGRARVFSEGGFTYDMGPSWYWMPDVFEKFFGYFGKTPQDYYELKRLDPSYQVFWEDEVIQIPASYDELKALFESIEPGAGNNLDKFLGEAAYKYDVGINKLVYQPGLSLTEFMQWDVMKSFFRIDLLNSMHKHVRQYFSHPKLLQLAEFPILFLGALPENTPALYSLMNYADMKLGTWYPMGGMGKVVEAMYKLAESLGVGFKFNEAVTDVLAIGNEVQKVTTTTDSYTADAVVVACDYHHAEQSIIPEQYRNYDKAYWESRDLAPSCIIYYLGLNKKLDGLQHHNLFFDAPFNEHAQALYSNPHWPSNPLMYVCCPSKTDATVAPADCENLFVLIPVAPGLKDTEEIRAQYYDIVMRRLEQRLGISVRDAVVYKRSYAHHDFVVDYNAYKGNAYGLANTLKQTAILKPSIKNKKLHNLFYTGQLTVPGPGVPPSLISGKIVATQVQKNFTRKNQPEV
ncbi:MAG: phytoene desaturase [Sphingobacteriales bacterium]|nr:MAG: phytoene desaturase [Sphingobacteriales bacterium]